jgi:hypothetical protein
MALTQLERNKRYLASPKGQYSKHRSNAHSRGVEFLLTFDQWWNIWQKSGHWKKRGNRSGRYVMARHNDEGPYRVGNVAIELFNANVVTRNRVVAKALRISKTIENAAEAPF